MSTSLADPLTWILEDGDDTLLCAARITRHKCTVIATWICYAGAQCSSTGASSVLWCEGRHEHHLKYGSDLQMRCQCGRAISEHWKVVPL